MTATHLDNIELNGSLDPAPAAVASFGICAFVREGITLGGDRIRTYSDLEGVQADETAGDVDATVTAAATVAFSQIPAPDAWCVIRKDVAESYTTAVTAARDEVGFYVVNIDDRTLAEIDTLSAYIETQRMLFVPQNADAGWLSTGVPAAFSDYSGLERTALLYHDTDTVWGDVGWSVARATFNPDEQSAPWDGRARGVSALATAPTTTQKAALDTNAANHGLEYRSATFFVDAGVNGSGRQLHEIVTFDWFLQRLLERVADLKLTYSDRGLKIPVNSTGQQLILAEIDTQLQTGVTAQHFNPGQTRATPLEITSADLAAKRLRFQIEMQFAGSASVFRFNAYFTRDPINTTGA